MCSAYLTLLNLITIMTIMKLLIIFLCSSLTVSLLGPKFLLKGLQHSQRIHITSNLYHFFSGSAAKRGLWPPRPRGFRDHTQRRSTVGRTPLDE
jgi:hypothetical protein